MVITGYRALFERLAVERCPILRLRRFGYACEAQSLVCAARIILGCASMRLSSVPPFHARWRYPPENRSAAEMNSRVTGDFSRRPTDALIPNAVVKAFDALK